MSLSAVVATRNSEKTIEECLSSLQGFDKVVVVDGYSKDHTIQLARKFGVQVCMEKNKGFFGAYDIGYRQTSSDYVMFIDSDAYLKGFDFEKALQSFKDPNVGIVICLAHTPVTNWMTNSINELSHWRDQELARYTGGKKLSWRHRQYRKFFMSKNLGAGSTTTGPCYIIRDSTVKAMGGINVKADDFVLGKILREAGYETRFHISETVFHIAPQTFKGLCRQWTVWGIRGAQTARHFYSRKERFLGVMMFCLGAGFSFVVGGYNRDVRYSFLMPLVRTMQVLGFVISSLFLRETERNYNAHQDR